MLKSSVLHADGDGGETSDTWAKLSNTEGEGVKLHQATDDTQS